MFQTLDFSGRTAVIMGASRGIGLATSKVLAAYGATVFLVGRHIETLQSASDAINKKGQTAHAIASDVSCYGDVQRVVSRTLDTTSQIDIWVNNAGVIEPLAHLADSDPSLWTRAVDINFKGVYYGMRAVIPVMLEKRSGIIVNISSGAANSALPGWSHYCSTKAAAKKLTETAHKEVAEHGIRIVGLSPGTVATDMMRKIKDSQINVVSNLEWSAHIPPEWAGEAVAFLCGPEGSDFAGTDFSIKTPDGRRRVGLPASNS